MSEINCNGCIRKPTCKFVDEATKFAHSNLMYSMFEYSESNQLDKALFEEMGESCKFFIPDDVDGEVNREKIKGAIHDFEWLKGDIARLENGKIHETYAKQRVDIIQGYIDKLTTENHETETE